jgi:hypothetical protein
MDGELPIPPQATHGHAREMIRLWLANQKLHCVLNIGFWEDRGMNERHAWGVILADMIQHIANAHEEEYGHDRRETIQMIRRSFEAEMEHPTSKRLGEFVRGTA